MKINTNSIFIIISIFLFSNAFAQDAWNTGGNITDSSQFIGTINSQPLLIKTDSVDRIIVGVNDTLQFKGISIFDSIEISRGFIRADSIRTNNIVGISDSIKFKGTAIFDSIKVLHGFIRADSIKARILVIGDPMTFGNNPIGSNDIITSSIGAITFQRTNGFGTIDDIKLGIGINPLQMLHLSRSGGPYDVYAQFTNQITAYGPPHIAQVSRVSSQRVS